MSSLFCIIANKGLHDFSVKKVFMLIFFLMGQYIVSVFTGLLTYMYCGFTRTKFMVLCFCVGCSFLSLTCGYG